MTADYADLIGQDRVFVLVSCGGLCGSLWIAAFAPQAHASAEYVIPFYPLRTCPRESCSVITYMPKSKGNYHDAMRRATRR